ncbi:MAG: phosphoribosylaminoimidazolesuccinocarboxamide synthase, partial [Candidatus Nanohaloarchaea archaeon]
MAGGEEVQVADLSEPSTRMSIDFSRKPDVTPSGDGYDYEDLDDADSYLIPLEVVFRNAVPIGSSVRRRYDPRDLGIDRDEWPDRNVDLDTPVIDF